MANAPGFRFYPTEEELLSFYLHHKLQASREVDIDRVIPVVYIYDYNPWDLPQLSGEGCRSDLQQQEWFFFIPKQEREVRGGRPNRLTTTGYWKATGSPGFVYSSRDNKIIGVKRTMVFYRGRARAKSGSKTDWKMNEYMAIHDHPHHKSSSSSNPVAPCQRGDYTICRVYLKSKCLRAFDRRPGAPITNKPPLLTIDQHQDQPSSSSGHQHCHNQEHPKAEIVRYNSIESSSSSGDDNHQQVQVNIIDQGTNNNVHEQDENMLDMDVDQQGPLWEWDSLMNWNHL